MMHEGAQPNICYFPTTVYFVDDDVSFLKSLSLGLDDNLACQFFSDTDKFLEALSQQARISQVAKNSIENLNDYDLEGTLPSDHALKMNLQQFYRHVYNVNRFAETAVVVLDFAMLQTNGLALARKIKSLNIPVNIILLTGQADHDTAMNAFNAHEIDNFIAKGGQNVIEQLHAQIQNLMQRYFQDQLSVISQNLLSDSQLCLMNPAFRQFFQQICVDHHIVEYYLLDASGSYLLLDKNANPCWLVVKTEKQMQTLDEVFEYVEDENTVSTIASVIRNREKLPFFLTSEEMQLPPQKWQPYLHSLQRLSGMKHYYYALVKDRMPHAFRIKEVLSYQKYLNQLADSEEVL